MGNAALRDGSYPKGWKCADVYALDSTLPDQLTINYQGACVEGKCKFCNHRTGYQCYPSTGRGTERYCVYPGKVVNSHERNWQEGSYYENPDAVWWAIIFTFFMITACVICGMAVCIGIGLKKK